MMTHPIHLHGMWSDLENDAGEFTVRKHTIDMPPGTRRTYRVRADALGRWAYHCHLLFHMEAGMFREVRVRRMRRAGLLTCCSASLPLAAAAQDAVAGARRSPTRIAQAAFPDVHGHTVHDRAINYHGTVRSTGVAIHPRRTRPAMGHEQLVRRRHQSPVDPVRGRGLDGIVEEAEIKLL